MRDLAVHTDSDRSALHSRGYYVGLSFMGLFYLLSGVNHFLHTASYLAIMPPYIPRPLAMVQISGVAEILGGIGLLIPNGFIFPSTRKAAAWGVIFLLIAISPVHINMCLHPDAFPNIPAWALWVRLPMQLVLIAWAWVYTRA